MKMNDNAAAVDDALAAYIAEFQGIPSLGRDEEIGCMEHVRAGDQLAEFATKRLLEENLLLVVSVAKRYRNDRLHIFDLIQKGNEGLLRAAQSLSDHSPESFSDHATDYVERAIREAISSSA
jgi:DNA-directed RNA polymerase sigma subunit (sigma70/sigma32)